MDLRDPRRLLLSSLFLFAEYTGCRGHSCSHIRIKDLLHITHKGGDMYAVNIKVRKIKGRDHKPIVMSLSGHKDTFSETDFIY